MRALHFQGTFRDIRDEHGLAPGIVLVDADASQSSRKKEQVMEDQSSSQPSPADLLNSAARELKDAIAQWRQGVLADDDFIRARDRAAGVADSHRATVVRPSSLCDSFSARQAADELVRTIDAAAPVSSAIVRVGLAKMGADDVGTLRRAAEDAIRLGRATMPWNWFPAQG